MTTCCPPCCLSSPPLLDSVVMISSLAKHRITRPSSKNIMPVLDTGHLLAFAGYGAEGEGEVRMTKGGSFRPGLWGSCEGGEEKERR